MQNQQLKEISRIADQQQAKATVKDSDEGSSAWSQKRLAEQLRMLKKQLAGFLRCTLTPLALMDRDFNLIRVNEAYARLLEMRPEELTGRNHFALFPDKKNHAIFQQVVLTQKAYVAHAQAWAYADQPERDATYWDWQLTPLLEAQGEVAFLVLQLEEVTQRQRALQQLEAQASRLQQLALELTQAEDRERQRLAQLLHNDLQQLLVGTKYHLQVLQRRLEDTPEGDQAMRQVRSLLDESIAKSRGLSHALSPPILHRGPLREVLDWLARDLQAKCGLRVSVETDATGELRHGVLGRFVFKTAQELLFNVVKHARTASARVVLKRTNGQVRLLVADEGQGFDPTTSKAREGEGGFGLSSIRQRAEALGGDMKVKSTPGHGSVVVLQIPDKLPSMKPGRDEARATAGSPRIPRADEHKG